MSENLFQLAHVYVYKVFLPDVKSIFQELPLGKIIESQWVIFKFLHSILINSLLIKLDSVMYKLRNNFSFLLLSFKPMVLNWGWFWLPETFVNVWRHSWLSHLGKTVLWHSVYKVRDATKHPPMHRTVSHIHNKELHGPKHQHYWQC